MEAPKTNNSSEKCDECCKFEFRLEGTYNSAEDCNISYETYTASHLQSWERFFEILFPHRTKSVNIQRKCDTIFQIIHYVIYNGKKHNPFHVGLAELFHDDSRAKLVIEILNKIGLCISYNDLQRIDFDLMNRVINVTGSNRVPVSFSIDKHSFMEQLKISTTMKQHHQESEFEMTQLSCCFKIRTKVKILQRLLVRSLQNHHKIRNNWTNFFSVRNL